jgi:hypothetical protein
MFLSDYIICQRKRNHFRATVELNLLMVSVASKKKMFSFLLNLNKVDIDIKFPIKILKDYVDDLLTFGNNKEVKVE